MREHKIVVLGTMGAGKSTLIRAVGNGKVVDTDVLNTDLSSGKQATTVAMDYTDVDLPNGDRLRLFGTPGQQRFDFIWPILLEGASGAVVLLDASVDNPIQSLSPYLEALKENAPQLPVVVGMTHCEHCESAMEECVDAAYIGTRSIAIVPVDAREEDDVLMLMDILMSEIETADLLTGVGP